MWIKKKEYEEMQTKIKDLRLQLAEAHGARDREIDKCQHLKILMDNMCPIYEVTINLKGGTSKILNIKAVSKEVALNIGISTFLKENKAFLKKDILSACSKRLREDVCECVCGIKNSFQV